jgi:hypothetical protein
MSRIIHRIVNGVAEVMASPMTLGSQMRGSGFDMKRSLVKKARMYDHAPNYDQSGNVTEAFKVRSLRKDIKNAK